MLFNTMGSNSNKNSMALFPQPQPSDANNHHGVLPSHLLCCYSQQTGETVHLSLPNSNEYVWDGSKVLHWNKAFQVCKSESHEDVQGSQAVSKLKPHLRSYSSFLNKRIIGWGQGCFISFNTFKKYWTGCLGFQEGAGQFPHSESG